MTSRERILAAIFIRRFAILSVFFHCALASSWADTNLANCWTAQNTGTTGNANSFSLGYRFTVASSIQVTHLGRVDYNGGGLAVPALARLYNWDTGTALADVTIPAGMTGRETNGALAVHYAALTNAITLQPGVNYLVAVEVSSGDFCYGVNATMSPGVQWIEGRATPVGSPAMPATANGTTFSIANTANAVCYLGPSFKFGNTNTNITLSSPGVRQIVQRNGDNWADIRLQGSLLGGVTRIEARAVVMPGSTNNGVSTGWCVITGGLTNSVFSGVLTNVTAGGWYQIEVRAVDAAANVLASVVVDHVGVGDLFVTAGQSNAGSFGSPAQTPTEDRVSAYILSSGGWKFAVDPQPNNSGFGGTGGSAWPGLGSRLVQSNQVPVGFIGLAYGSTTVAQWSPGTANYKNLTNVLKGFGANGVRAVLWHQGESDSLAPTAAVAYATGLSNIIVGSRLAAGWNVPWGIAEVSFHPSATRKNEEPVAAGQRIVNYSVANCFRGPRTDDFNLEGKVSPAGGVHFNAIGLADHAQQWANALCSVQDLTPKNGDFESNTNLADGASDFSTRVIGWNRLNSAGTGLADGNNGYFNPDNSTYPNANDNSIYGGVLPNMSGKHVGTLAGSTYSNSFLQTLNAQLQPNRYYTFQVALGVRTNASVFGGYALDILTNGVPAGSGMAGDLTALNALAGGNATGAFTVVTCLYNCTATVATNQQLAIRITKPSGSDTYLDFDNVRVTSQNTPYGQWQQLHWGSQTNAVSLPAANPAGDGLPNLIKSQLAGMDPFVSNAMPLPTATKVSGQDYLQMQLTKSQWATPDGVGLRISHNLMDWFAPTNASNGDMILLDNISEYTLQLKRSAFATTLFQIWAQ